MRQAYATGRINQVAISSHMSTSLNILCHIHIITHICLITYSTQSSQQRHHNTNCTCPSEESDRIDTERVRCVFNVISSRKTSMILTSSLTSYTKVYMCRTNSLQPHLIFFPENRKLSCLCVSPINRTHYKRNTGTDVTLQCIYKI